MYHPDLLKNSPGIRLLGFKHLHCSNQGPSIAKVRDAVLCVFGSDPPFRIVVTLFHSLEHKSGHEYQYR